MVEQFWQEPTDVENRIMARHNLGKFYSAGYYDITCLILEQKYMQTPLWYGEGGEGG